MQGRRSSVRITNGWPQVQLHPSCQHCHEQYRLPAATSTASRHARPPRNDKPQPLKPCQEETINEGNLIRAERDSSSDADVAQPRPIVPYTVHISVCLFTDATCLPGPGFVQFHAARYCGDVHHAFHSPNQSTATRRALTANPKQTSVQACVDKVQGKTTACLCVRTCLFPTITCVTMLF